MYCGNQIKENVIILKEFAHIVDMGELFIWFFFFGMIILFAPIYVNVDSYLDVRENKLWFSVRLYRIFKMIGGYMQLSRDGLAIHLSKRKVIILPYDQMMETRKKFDITSGFQLMRFHVTIETSGADQLYGIFIAAALQSVSGIAFSTLQALHPFLSLKNNVLLSERNNLTVSMQMTTTFNMLVLLVAIGKKLLEVILKWIKEKKSTASWKKLRSN